MVGVIVNVLLRYLLVNLIKAALAFNEANALKTVRKLAVLNRNGEYLSGLL